MKHETTSLISQFTPVFDDEKNKSIGIALGYQAAKMLFGDVKSGTILDEFNLGPKEEEEYFGSNLTVGMIGSFYSPILNKFEPYSVLNFSCKMNKVPGSDTNYKYKCQFLQTEKPNTVVLNISELVLTTSFDIDLSTEEKYHNKSINIGLKNFRFTSMTLPIRLPTYLIEEFLAFLQPFAGWIKGGITADIPIVGEKMNWEYEEAKTDKKVYSTFYYKEK